MKFCSKCKEEKSLELFPKNRSKKDGYHDCCKVCHTLAQKRRYNKDPQKFIQVSKQWYANNLDKKREYDRGYYLRDKERKNKHNRAWLSRNKDKMAKASSIWKRLNSGKVASYQSRRRAATFRATPPWLTETQIKEMENLYWLAKDLLQVTGERYHVDHIVPLQGKNVCGLHVPWNLQVLPSDLNLRKSNKYG